VHVPFCAARCGYCDFSSGALSSAALDRYVLALEREIGRRAPDSSGTVFRSVFFGGGTPSTLSGRHLRRVVSALRASFTIDPRAEFTIEVNPESANERLLAAWREAGVNRLSFGVQSFHDDELEGLGRLHDSRRPAIAFARARALGFERLSLDLMFGFPGHGQECWSETLDRALELEPEHLSAYAFIVEAGTPLGNAVLRGEARVLEAEAQADAYAALTGRMAAAGMGCYETSNFARRDAESRHNLGYWLRRPYVGLGPSAHGLVNGERYSNLWTLERWAEALERGLAPEAERERETPASRASEIVMLALRLGSGLVITDYPRPVWDEVRRFYGAALDSAVASQRLERTPEGWRVRPEHRFVADDVIAWVECRSTPFDTGGPGPIIHSPCPNPLSPAA
jgi:oxygen-independent coproporphyrinogen-3 oxidase